MPGIKQTNKDLLIAQPTVVNALGQPIMENNEVKFIPGVGDEQGGLACCDSWGHKESDTTERLI